MQNYKIFKLQVSNFRNLENNVIEFGSNINYIFGSNGNGKSNLLESIYYLIYKKSFRKNSHFEEILSVDADKAEMTFLSLFKNENDQFSLSGRVYLNNQEWFKDNQVLKKKIELATVFINPFEAFFFHNQASYRRDFIDGLLSQYSKPYKKKLKYYNQTLKQRNILLKEKPSNYVSIIRALDDNLSEVSFELIEDRVQFLEEINVYLKDIFNKLFSLNHKLELNYSSKFYSNSKDQIRDYYRKNEGRDDASSLTLYGVHRDDYIFYFDSFNAFEYCSLGQQKMAYLSLIFAYIELFRYKFNSYPIILIDDVSGELDAKRLESLIEYLKSKDFQVLITTANDNFKESLEKIPTAHKIIIHDGKVMA